MLAGRGQEWESWSAEFESRVLVTRAESESTPGGHCGWRCAGRGSAGETRADLGDELRGSRAFDGVE